MTRVALDTTPGSPAGTTPHTPKRKARPRPFALVRSATTASSAASSIAAVSTTGSTTGTSAAVVITITNFAYQGPDSVSPGSTVTVKNEDSQAHTVTSDQAGLFDAVVPGGGNVVFTAPTTAGSYAYHCTYHSNMHGTLIVE